MIRSLLLGLSLATVCGCAFPPGGPSCVTPSRSAGEDPHAGNSAWCGGGPVVAAAVTVGENIILPEQRTIAVRDPAQIPPAVIPNNVPPRTVTHPQPGTPEWNLSLDEAIRIALVNAQVIRVLSGTTAVSSGQTIYDAAISNTSIDQDQARFDPVLKWNNQWSRTNTPVAISDPFDPIQTLITSTPTDAYLSTFGLTKTNVLGGQWGMTWTENPMRFSGSSIFANPLFPGSGFPLNPQDTSTVALTYTQPLLQGGGYLVNLAPVMIARLNTEQSFFVFKDSVQEMVRGVIEAYWDLVQARIAAWAAKIQVDQSKENYERESARLKTGLADLSNVAQSRVTYNQFRANLVAAEANVLTREGALRNILGLPPSDDRQIVPVSAPTVQRLAPKWDELIQLAAQRRPDIAALKVVTQADEVRVLQARNQALPQLDAVAQYQFNGLSGIAPTGQEVETEPGAFTNWMLGLNFSMPLGRRQGRALVRQQELTVARDRANVEQGVHAAIHQLASTVRDLDSAYEQYLAFKETRAAADANVRVQNAKFRTQQQNGIYLIVLQALTDWGNAVTSEAQQLINYNIALANLERQTGTILETHGLVFFEERLKAAGPLGLCGPGRLYPAATVLDGIPYGYPSTGEPAENSFDLQNPAPREKQPSEELLPVPRPLPPSSPR